ncbi:hypothetical protein [Spiroplasma endosymbiont of Atherix ibis]|uniref:hypothetical protein n=1 Tax=Spiroplasma endosymbiont of Atherix ibis TaxID=3066291 RepID=UPI0030CF44D4
MNNDYEFLVKSNIQYYSIPENKDKLTIEEKKQFTNDVEKLFKVKLLTEKLNKLKKLNKYKVILDEVDSLFEHVELLFNDNFEINSGEVVEGTYIGNVVVDYNIVTNYKGLNDVEKFKQFGALKYTSTESKAFKDFGDVMYKNIAKDMFISLEAKEYVNFKWSKEDYEAFVNSNAQLKKYYDGNKGFQKALLKTINDKYFKPQFSNLEIAYSKTSIYKSDNFLEKNKEYLIMNNLGEQNVLKLKEIDSKEIISKIFLGDEKVISRNLKNDVFNLLTLEKNKKKYRVAQDNFLNGFLSQTEVGEYQKTKYYDLGVAMGYADFVAPVIGIGVAGGSSYQHKLPDFKLAISYSMNGKDNLVTNKAFIDLSLKLFGIYKTLFNPSTYEDIDKKFKLKFYYPVNNINEKLWAGYNFSRENWDIINNLEPEFSLFTNYYFEQSDKKLNLLDISKKIFKSSNILYSFDVKDKKLIHSNRLINWFSSKDTSIKPTIFISSDKNDNKGFFKNLNYMRFDLFGIVKINIYLENNKEEKKLF